MKRELIQKIETKSAVIAIIGMGYVGLPLMLRLENVTRRATSVDLSILACLLQTTALRHTLRGW